MTWERVQGAYGTGAASFAGLGWSFLAKFTIQLDVTFRQVLLKELCSASVNEEEVKWTQ